MRQLLAYSLGATIALGGLIWLAGCETSQPHRMVSDSDGHVMMCQKCYDEVRTIRHQPVKGAPMTGTIRKHMCPDCKAEMTIYREGGKLMVRCPHCAPEGIPCDKCRPPRTNKS